MIYCLKYFYSYLLLLFRTREHLPATRDTRRFEYLVKIASKTVKRSIFQTAILIEIPVADLGKRSAGLGPSYSG